jgi:hypothetical protein
MDTRAEAGASGVGGRSSSLAGSYGVAHSFLGPQRGGWAAVYSGSLVTPEADPRESGTLGAYAGVGNTFSISNASDLNDLQGTFKTFNFNFGLIVPSAGFTLSVGDNGVYRFSVRNPLASPGLGFAFTGSTSDTTVCGASCTP